MTLWSSLIILIIRSKLELQKIFKIFGRQKNEKFCPIKKKMKIFVLVLLLCSIFTQDPECLKKCDDTYRNASRISVCSYKFTTISHLRNSETNYCYTICGFLYFNE
jgi:hypothetical protein